MNQPPPTVRETGSGSQGLKPVLERLTHEREPDERLLTGPRGGVLTTACVRDATKWDQLVTELELPSLTGHGLRHTGATWLADAGIPLHVLHGILGHKSIETTRGYLHPDTRHLTDAAARANAFLDGRKYPGHESPASSGLATALGDEKAADRSPKRAPGPGQVPARHNGRNRSVPEGVNIRGRMFP